MTANCIAMNVWSFVPAEHQCMKAVTGKFITFLYLLEMCICTLNYNMYNVTTVEPRLTATPE